MAKIDGECCRPSVGGIGLNSNFITARPGTKGQVSIDISSLLIKLRLKSEISPCPRSPDKCNDVCRLPFRGNRPTFSVVYFAMIIYVFCAPKHRHEGVLRGFSRSHSSRSRSGHCFHRSFLITRPPHHLPPSPSLSPPSYLHLFTLTIRSSVSSNDQVSQRSAFFQTRSADPPVPGV